MPEDCERGVAIRGAGVVNVQPASVAHLHVGLAHHPPSIGCRPRSTTAAAPPCRNRVRGYQPQALRSKSASVRSNSWPPARPTVHTAGPGPRRGASGPERLSARFASRDADRGVTRLSAPGAVHRRDPAPRGRCAVGRRTSKAGSSRGGTGRRRGAPPRAHHPRRTGSGHQAGQHRLHGERGLPLGPRPGALRAAEVPMRGRGASAVAGSGSRAARRSPDRASCTVRSPPIQTFAHSRRGLAWRRAKWPGGPP